MIVTKEQQERILLKYMENHKNTLEINGFVDGIDATLKMIDTILKNNK